MNLIQIAEIVLGSIVSIGILIAGVGYGVGQYRRGQVEVKKDDIDLFNGQLDSLRKICTEQADEIKDLQQDIKKHTGEIGRLNGIIEEKDRKIGDLTKLIQNRDPALMEFISFATKALTSFQEEMHKFMPAITSLEAKLPSLVSAKSSEVTP